MKTTTQTDCQAKQYSCQMACECGLVWDMNDPDPPECPRQRGVIEDDQPEQQQ